MSLWKQIQAKVGARPDGVPGPATARAIAKALGIEPAPSGIVKGTGVNISRIVIHCTATREGQDVSAATIRKWHKGQGWSDIGYHFVIRLDGTIEAGRPESKVGSHVRGHNSGSIAVVYVGGLDAKGKAKDTRTPEQRAAMKRIVKDLLKAYPGSDVLGHRDHPKVAKDCPCFDVRSWWESVK
jgi:N-acetylmuramoyl-L-alanine amidase